MKIDILPPNKTQFHSYPLRKQIRQARRNRCLIRRKQRRGLNQILGFVGRMNKYFLTNLERFHLGGLLCGALRMVSTLKVAQMELASETTSTANNNP